VPGFDSAQRRRAGTDDLLITKPYASRLFCRHFSRFWPFRDSDKQTVTPKDVGAMLDRLLHHGYVLKCGPKSWRTKTAATD
jgi:hypothetical protein